MTGQATFCVFQSCSTSRSGGRPIAGSWMMLDAFGGCCVYDERSGADTSGHGVLGWLLAGSDAFELCNADDRTLIVRAIESLPDALQAAARQHVVEGRVHRWAGALSGTPGGFPLRDPRAAHQPEPIEHEHLTMVGDYLFDSTLNGVLRSAEIATDLVLRGAHPSASRRSSRALSQSRRTVRSVMPRASAISTSVMPAK